MPISPGVYRIINAKTRTIFELGRGSRTNIHCWQQLDGPNQQWFVLSSGDGVVLKNFEFGKYVHTTSIRSGSKMLGSNNITTWNLQQDGNEWTISIPGTNYVLELESGQAANGTVIQLWENNGEKHQKWIFEKINDTQPEQLNQPPQPLELPQYRPDQQYFFQINQLLVPFVVSPGTYFLKNVMSGTLVTLCHTPTDEGVEISGHSHSGGSYQKWQLQPTGHGQSVTLRNAQTNTYLWFQSQSFVPSVLVKSSYHPQEYIISAADRGFYISPAQQPNHALSLFYGSTENGTEIGIWHNEQQDNQKWYFDRTLYEVQQPDLTANIVDPNAP